MESGAATESSATEATTQIDEDLGFGRVVAQQVRGRFLRKDGTPNSRKYGIGSQAWERLYLQTLRAGWPTFLIWVVSLELLANGAFALAYTSVSAGSLAGSEALGLADPFFRAFCFSVGVFTLTGTGPMHAVGTTANWLVALESILGSLFLVGIGGILLARILRPRGRIRFSQSGVVAPYRQGRGFMFRLINLQLSELIDVEVQANLAWYEDVDGRRLRRFHQLSLERRQVEFFTLHWTVVHPITAESPLRGVTPEQLRASEAEFLVQVTGLEETFSTRVTARTSYFWDEVRWDVKFADMFVPSPDGVITVDIDRLDRFDRLPEGTTSQPAAIELAAA